LVEPGGFVSNFIVKKIWNLLLKPIIEALPENVYLKVRREALNLVSFIGITNSKYAMDKKIVSLFKGKRNGTFIEVGAADGLDQSNTLLLERKLGWTGLLVEPVQAQFTHCQKVRPKSIVERFILTSIDDKAHNKEIHSTALGSRVNDKSMRTTLNDEQVDDYQKANIGAEIESVPACTLDSLLERHGIDHVDIFSLDVEGFEENVLNGFSGNKCTIDYLLVEAQKHEKFQEYAQKRGWRFVEAWTDGDYLYRLSE
jgi:FkbM family methyltransferase